MFSHAGYKVWNTPTNPKKLKSLLLRQPLKTTVIFFDYAGTTEGKYRGVRPALMFIRKEYINATNEIGYIKTRSVTDSASVVITENNLDRLVYELLKEKDEFGNLKDYGAYASKSDKPGLDKLKGSISSRSPEIQINPLDDED